MTKSLLESSILNTVEYRSLSAGTVPSNEYLIATTVVGGTPAASVTFDVSAYIGVYRHLKIVASIRTSYNATSDSTYIRFNSDISSGSNYTLHYIQGNASSVVSGSYPNSAGPFIIDNTAATGTSGVFSPVVVDIFDPFSSNKNTTMMALWGVGLSSPNLVSLRSSVWLNTEPLTQIKMGSIQGTPNFVTGSRFSLYGVTA